MRAFTGVATIAAVLFTFACGGDDPGMQDDMGTMEGAEEMAPMAPDTEMADTMMYMEEDTSEGMPEEMMDDEGEPEADPAG